MKKVIIRDLKEYRFLFDTETRYLAITDKENENIVSMDKVRVASLARFLIRVLYSMSINRRK